MTDALHAFARDAVLEAVGKLQGLAIMGMTKQQQDTAMRLANQLLTVVPLLETNATRVGEPAQPSVDAPATEWFVYYRQMIAYLSRELPRLRAIENAASRVAGARRNKVVTDQAVLDLLDTALEAQ